MILIIVATFFAGVALGVFLIGILATGKQADMWRAIEDSAYRNDNRLCKALLEIDDEIEDEFIN